MGFSFYDVGEGVAGCDVLGFADHLWVGGFRHGVYVAFVWHAEDFVPTSLGRAVRSLSIGSVFSGEMHVYLVHLAMEHFSDGSHIANTDFIMRYSHKCSFIQ